MMKWKIEELRDELDDIIKKIKENQSNIAHLLPNSQEARELLEQQSELMGKFDLELKETLELPPKPNWMEEEWARDTKLKRGWVSPYSKWESIKWFIKHIPIVGPSRMHRKKTKFIPQDTKLNEIDEKRSYDIVFVGDVMDMKTYDLQFDQSVVKFLGGVDLIVGNLEGTICIQPGYLVDQKHDPIIMKKLTGNLELKASQWLLGLSNNHSGDYGFADYIYSLDQLRWYGFNVFGRKDIPSFEFPKDEDDHKGFKLHIMSGSEWQNQKCTYQTLYKEGCYDDMNTDDKVFNILFPHWNYENELYPRKHERERAKNLLEKWDLIFGHHTHTPQPITEFVTQKNGETVKKLVVYSGGNFTSGINTLQHNYGIVTRCRIGPLKQNPNIIAVGDVSWRFCQSKRTGDMEVELQTKQYEKLPTDTSEKPQMTVFIEKDCFFFKNVENADPNCGKKKKN